MKNSLSLIISLILILFLITPIVAGDVYDLTIARERNRAMIIVAAIIGVTIGGSIVYASFNKKKKQ